jgi:hypothetical protein
MGLDDFLKHKEYARHPYRKPYDDRQINFQSLLIRLKQDPKMRFMAAIVLIVALVIILILLILLFPLLIKLVNYISQVGLQGILDEVMANLEKIWKGSGK